MSTTALTVVLMHLLVLGAFCRDSSATVRRPEAGLNAPSGAGCFLSPPLGTASLRHFQGLERHRLRKHPAGPASTAPI